MLSLTISWGNPSVLKALFNIFVIIVDVDLIICISGHLEDESIIPKILSPVGIEPYKSMRTFSQGIHIAVSCKTSRLPSHSAHPSTGGG